MKVEVVGGLCDYMLGKSQVKYTIAGCDAWSNLPVMKTESSCFTAPAFPLEFEIAGTYSLSITFLRCSSQFHGLTLHFIDITHQQAKEYFCPKGIGCAATAQYIDLTEFYTSQEINDELGLTWESCGAMTNADENATDTVELPTVRFQYPGDLNMDISLIAPGIFYPVKGCSFGGYDGDSFALFNTYDTNPYRFMWQVKLYYDLGLGENFYCHQVETSLRISVISELGVDTNENPSFASWESSLTGTYEPPLDACSVEPGCEYDVSQYARDNGTIVSNVDKGYDDGFPTGDASVSWSGYDSYLFAGRPNIVSDYTKRLTFQVFGSNSSMSLVEPKVIHCLVTGKFDGSPFNSVQVPIYEPIMILRDPPGSYCKCTFSLVMLIHSFVFHLLKCRLLLVCSP